MHSHVISKIAITSPTAHASAMILMKVPLSIHPSQSAPAASSLNSSSKDSNVSKKPNITMSDSIIYTQKILERLQVTRLRIIQIFHSLLASFMLSQSTPSSSSQLQFNPEDPFYELSWVSPVVPFSPCGSPSAGVTTTAAASSALSSSSTSTSCLALYAFLAAADKML